MPDKRTPDRPQPPSTGDLPPRIMPILDYLGVISLFVATLCVIAAYVISDDTQERLVLVFGLVIGAVGFLCWGLSRTLRYRHPQLLQPPLVVTDSAIIRRRQTFIVAWTCFVGVAALGALAVLIATQGFSRLTASILPVGTLIVFVIIAAPVWVVSRRLQRRIQGAG